MVEAPNKEKGELPYPNSPVKVGDVLELSDTTTINGKTVYYKKYPPIHLEVDMLNDFPHIFRKMHWSEGIGIIDMPKWVAANLYTKHRVYPVEYTLIFSRIYIRVVGDESWLDIETACNDWKLTPATEAEYLEYLKSMEK